ncbi:MAG: YlxR family protein [Deltaproteobacteria bacterium]|nr:YlxR family protein [Deltaproteobacteria bacterium]
MQPRRMCVACRRRRPAAELRRWSAGPAGLVPGAGPGRGAYVCRDERCERKAYGRGGVARALSWVWSPVAKRATAGTGD